ncbi:hypothetical protein CesoFtcFv8_013536 [Champsocephalus esox]|uniref:Uncharacterized protein n=1 Tax=Champsocephalus esox TaxID=159716 RepID=A0AAN8BUY6_9TELE|nr:hypothetical protein CesoFtcFv8_013536 [Champsocephalus esox]
MGMGQVPEEADKDLWKAREHGDGLIRCVEVRMKTPGKYDFGNFAVGFLRYLCQGVFQVSGSGGGRT